MKTELRKHFNQPLVSTDLPNVKTIFLDYVLEIVGQSHYCSTQQYLFCWTLIHPLHKLAYLVEGRLRLFVIFLKIEATVN